MKVRQNQEYSLCFLTKSHFGKPAAASGSMLCITVLLIAGYDCKLWRMLFAAYKRFFKVFFLGIDLRFHPAFIEHKYKCSRLSVVGISQLSSHVNTKEYFRCCFKITNWIPNCHNILIKKSKENADIYSNWFYIITLLCKCWHITSKKTDGNVKKILIPRKRNELSRKTLSLSWKGLKAENKMSNSTPLWMDCVRFSIQFAIVTWNKKNK